MPLSPYVAWKRRAGKKKTSTFWSLEEERWLFSKALIKLLHYVAAWGVRLPVISAVPGEEKHTGSFGKVPCHHSQYSCLENWEKEDIQRAILQHVVLLRKRQIENWGAGNIFWATSVWPQHFSKQTRGCYCHGRSNLKSVEIIFIWPFYCVHAYNHLIRKEWEHTRVSFRFLQSPSSSWSNPL